MTAREVVRTGSVTEHVLRGSQGPPGPQGPQGVPGIGVLLLEATAVIPADIPPGTPNNTIIFQKTA